MVVPQRWNMNEVMLPTFGAPFLRLMRLKHQKAAFNDEPFASWAGAASTATHFCPPAEFGACETACRWRSRRRTFSPTWSFRLVSVPKGLSGSITVATPSSLTHTHTRLQFVLCQASPERSANSPCTIAAHFRSVSMSCFVDALHDVFALLKGVRL